MRDLEWIIKSAKFVVQKNQINERIDEHPVIHHIIISYPKDESYLNKQNNAEKFWKCLKYLLQKKADVDVLDKYGASPLYNAAGDGIADPQLYDLLLNHGANPNLVSKKLKMYSCLGFTAFERALISKTDKDIIAKLFAVTKVTPLMQQNAKKIHQYEMNELEPDIEILNPLVDYKLIKPTQYRCLVPENLQTKLLQGFWMRNVESITKELKVLSKRAQLSDSRLSKQRHNTKHSNYQSSTLYSPCTFVSYGMPVRLFQADAGVMIRNTGRVIPYWYDGCHGEELTQGMFSKNNWREGRESSGKLYESREIDIKIALEAQYKRILCDSMRDERFRADKHGILKNRRKREMFLPWNEGPFRYKKKDIFGFHVAKNKRESVIKVLKLRWELNLPKHPIYHYSLGNFHRVRSSELMKQHKIKYTDVVV